MTYTEALEAIIGSAQRSNKEVTGK